MRREYSRRPNVAARAGVMRVLHAPEAEALAVLAAGALILALLVLPQGVHVVRLVGAALLTLVVAHLVLRPRRS